jgi:hypothetical protein
MPPNPPRPQVPVKIVEYTDRPQPIKKPKRTANRA